MTYSSAILEEAVRSYFLSEVWILILIVLLSLVAVIASFFLSKNHGYSSGKTLLMVLAAGIGAVVLITIRVVALFPIYQDYRHMSYTIEENATFYIIEGTNNSWESKNEVLLTTEAGEEIKLTITNDYQFETNAMLSGTVVYTNHSKHIVWYHMED
jgi:hypothetical protein